ncbi:MAG: nucleotidyl transferase AbiEii/AbiGii toxin family protein [Kiritimatiellae bacterium]|nr:nucleotidyl transferase AbiEii/AbiGii toxin family protein [Kiritimatiellia bacterium]
MIALTEQDVLFHQASVPWPSLRQVEHDLLLCRAMASIFGDSFLRAQVAMRGGTLLHKVYLAPPSRFSEDIDLVVFGERPEGHIRKALRRVLAGVLGRPRASVWDSIGLAVRNTVRPSRVLRMTYAVPAVSTQGPPLQVVVEANVTERTSYRPISDLPFDFSFRRDRVHTVISGYDIHEMLGTKMRALFQRRRGRDLFDLFWALEHARPAVDPALVVGSFLHYLRREGTQAGRREFMNIVQSHLSDPGFRSDTDHLLCSGIEYDPDRAGDCIRAKLLSLLPER